MELKELKCKNCGANLEVDAGATEVFCKFCNTKFAVESAENIAYQEEKGRIKAQREELDNNIKKAAEIQNELQKQQWKNTPMFLKVFAIGIFVVAFLFFIFVFVRMFFS